MNLHDLTSRSAHVRHGVKTGLATVLAYAVTDWLGLPMGFWAVLSAVIVMQINVADSISMCLYRFTGTALGAAIGLALLLVVPKTPWAMGAALFMAVGFCAYMTRYSSRYRMAAITAVIVLLAGAHEPDPVTFSLYRVFEIGVGVACAFAVSVLLWPARAGVALRERLQQQFANAAERYDAVNEAFLSRQSPLPDAFLSELDTEVRENRELLQKALRHERLLYNDDTALLSRQVGMLERCLDHMHALLGAVNTAYGEGFPLIMEPELRALAKASEDAMRHLGQGRAPDPTPLRQALAASQKRLHELRQEGKTRRFHLRKMLQIMAFIYNSQALAEDLLRGIEQAAHTSS